jgi:hypothetical protein
LARIAAQASKNIASLKKPGPTKSWELTRSLARVRTRI